MHLIPYLNFNGNCELALNFYRDCLNGQFESLNRFNDGPDEMGGTKVPEDFKHKIMHMTLRFGDNVIMASDSIEEVPAGGNVSLCMNMTGVDELTAVFNNLSEGGEITLPLQDTFWGAHFGMFTDKFGVRWMFNCQASK